jgi:phosphate transport system permease protein
MKLPGRHLHGNKMSRFSKISRQQPWFNRLQKTIRHGDIPWQVIIILMSIVIIIVMVSIGWMLWRDSSTSRTEFGWSFIIPTANATWDPVNSIFQSWPFIYGTLLTSITAIVLAVPVSLGIAIFLSELCPESLRLPLNWLVELLAAIPSVIYGLWGIFVFLPTVVAPVGVFLLNTLGHIPGINVLFTGPVPESGSSRLAAAFILMIMIIPTISAVTRDVLLSIPNDQREAAMALGATKWESIWQVILPFGMSGILGAVILGLGRALGETMAVTMVIGNSIEGTPSLLRPGYTMASIIANEFAEAVTTLHTEALIEIGLTLFIITLLLNIIARLLVWSVARRTTQEARA